MSTCNYCEAPLTGRSDKKFCDQYCKSAHHYKEAKNSLQLFRKIDRQLKINRKILKSYNRKGLTTVRTEELEKDGFNPKFFTHYYKTSDRKVYLFCFEYGFLMLTGHKEGKMLLVQVQDYMLRGLGAGFEPEL